MIVSLTGSADDFDLVFSRVGEDWAAVVPPDLSDGQYAATLYAVSDTGATSVYRGMLYMSGGICRIELSDDRYYITLLPGAIAMKLLPDGLEITLRRCRHAG